VGNNGQIVAPLDVKSDDLIQSEKENIKNKLMLNIKFQDSEVNIPAYIVPVGFLTIMFMIFIEPLTLLIGVPIVISFMGGIVMEKISLDYEKNLINKKSNDFISILEEE